MLPPQFSAKLSYQCRVTQLKFLSKSGLKLAFSGKTMLPRHGKTMGKLTPAEEP